MAVLSLDDRFWLIETLNKMNSNKEFFIKVIDFLEKINLSKELASDVNAEWNFTNDGKVTWNPIWEKNNVKPLEIEIPSIIVDVLKKKFSNKAINNADRIPLINIGVIDVQNEV